LTTTTINNPFISGLYRCCVAGIVLSLVSGCGALNSMKTAQPSFYTLDSGLFSMQVSVPGTAPTLIINPPHASAGFDTPRIIYIREPHRLEYYAHNEWIDTPARMLAPLIIAAIEGSGAFRAVVLTPSAAVGDLRLDTEIIRLQHEIGGHPSRVHFTLRAYIVENITRKVLGWKEFDETVAVTSEDPYGSVIAANRAVQKVLVQLADFCVEAAADWQGLE
jgi:cholesterol transport system auxiliary component